MAIYLDNQTRPTLKRIVNAWIAEHPSDWIAGRIFGKLKEDEERLDKIDHCQHTTARYVGEKTCCRECGSFYQPGMGEAWTYVEPKDDPHLKP